MEHAGKHDKNTIKYCKVLLINPPLTLKKGYVSWFGFYVPLGLAYIAGVLLKEEYTVEILDCLMEGKDIREKAPHDMVRIGLSMEQIKEMIIKKKPTIVGINNNFYSYGNDPVKIAEFIRSCLPQTYIIMGGAGTPKLNELLSTNVIDVLVNGEAEYTFRDLVHHISRGHIEEARKVKGTTWQLHNKIITNPPPELITDLDSIPFPAYHLFPMEKYIWQKQGNFAASMRWPIGHMITSRGCIYNCIFCSTTKYFMKYRARSIENVIDEIKLLIARYHIKEFHFHDDCFLSDSNRVRNFCNKIIEEKMDIKWHVSQGINSIMLDEDLLELMHKSGLYRIGFPIESGCPETLKYIRKPVDLEKVQKLIKKCNYLGIYLLGNFIIGFPEETKEQIEQTVNFLVHSGLDYVNIPILQPFPNADIYAVFEQLGILQEGLKPESTFFHSEYNTVHMTANELNSIRTKALRRFAIQRIVRMMSPYGIKRYLLPKLRSKENITYFVRIVLKVLQGATPHHD